MADWQRTLRLNPEWDRAQEHEISTQELARSIAAKLRSLAPFSADRLIRPNEWDNERDEITDRFEILATSPAASQQEFNCVMQDLYDWGDQRMYAQWNGKKVCWIDTMSKVETA